MSGSIPIGMLAESVCGISADAWIKFLKEHETQQAPGC